MPSVFGAFGGRRDQDRPAEPADRRPRIDGIAVDRLPEVIAEARRGRRRRVTLWGDHVLSHPCHEVRHFGTPALRDLIDDMFATMACCDGVGLAANQIGVPLRVFVYDCEDAYGVRHVGHVINPVLEGSERSGKEISEEGCLSVPGPVAEVGRPRTATVRGLDQWGRPVVVEGTGLLARCLRHECDHLDGVTYVDHLSGRERRRVLRDMEDQQPVAYARWDERAARLGKPAMTDLPLDPPVVDDRPVQPPADETTPYDAGIVGYDPAACSPSLPVGEAPAEALAHDVERLAPAAHTEGGPGHHAPSDADLDAMLGLRSLPEGAGYDDLRTVDLDDDPLA